MYIRVPRAIFRNTVTLSFKIVEDEGVRRIPFLESAKIEGNYIVQAV